MADMYREHFPCSTAPFFGNIYEVGINTVLPASMLSGLWLQLPISGGLVILLFCWQGRNPSGSRGLKVFWTKVTESREDKNTELENMAGNCSLPLLFCISLPKKYPRSVKFSKNCPNRWSVVSVLILFKLSSTLKSPGREKYIYMVSEGNMFVCHKATCITEA